jgi:hypothetical protein
MPSCKYNELVNGIRDKMKKLGIFCYYKILVLPGMMVHACNSSNSGGRDQEDHGSSPAQPKSKQDPISKDKLGMVVYICNPSYTGGVAKKIVVQGQPCA